MKIFHIGRKYLIGFTVQYSCIVHCTVRQRKLGTHLITSVHGVKTLELWLFKNRADRIRQVCSETVRSNLELLWTCWVLMHEA